MERLGDEGLKGDKLEGEIRRARTLVLVAREITSVATLMLKAKVAQGESIPGIIRLPDILE